MNNHTRWGHQLSVDDPVLSAVSLPLAGPQTRWVLRRDAETGQLQISDDERPRQRPLQIDFGSADISRRIAAGRSQPLAKACGLHKGGSPQIIDLTAGLCRDAWCLAALGARLQVYERHPLLFALIHDALRLADTPVSARIQAHAADAREASLHEAQVLFLDPMFPTAGKRAAPELSMQILQQLLGPDEDAQSLLDTALASGVARVVLKRPPRGARVRLGEPALSFGGGRAVYDVYLPR